MTGSTVSALPIDQPEIPDKLYFRIGEVARLVGVKPHVLRYWETEFGSLVPKKSGTGQRLYRRKEVETLLEVKRLLYDKRYTIEGARKELETRAKAAANPARPRRPKPVPQGELFASPVDVAAIRHELQEILDLLS